MASQQRGNKHSRHSRHHKDTQHPSPQDKLDAAAYRCKVQDLRDDLAVARFAQVETKLTDIGPLKPDIPGLEDEPTPEVLRDEAYAKMAKANANLLSKGETSEFILGIVAGRNSIQTRLGLMSYPNPLDSPLDSSFDS